MERILEWSVGTSDEIEFDIDTMIIDKKILDELTEAAKVNPRLRQSMDS